MSDVFRKYLEEIEEIDAANENVFTQSTNMYLLSLCYVTGIPPDPENTHELNK